jgi:LEA14-like dessication related protein
MKRRDVLRASVVGAVALPTTGCATLWDLINNFIKVPTLTIRGMAVQKMTLSSMQVKFFADLANPNPFGFKLFGLDYLLRVAGDQLAKGRAPQGIDLRAGAKAKTELVLDFDLGRTASAILELLEKKVVDYDLDVVGKFLSKEGGVSVPVGFSGKLAMPKLPVLNVKSFTPTGVSASGVEFRLVTDVKNANDFEIPIDGFSFDIKVDGRRVLENKGARGLRIQPGKTGSVPVDFKVGLGALGISLAEAVSGKRMRWEVGAHLTSGRLKLPFKDAGTFRLA